MAEPETKAGLILIDKAPGLTSFSSLGICKKSFGTKKVGHTGTLDLFAEGLLLVCVSDATRLVPYFVGLDKSYIATIRFGTETDTLDPGGKVVAEGRTPSLTEIESALAAFKGKITQVPPAFSAVHVDGKRAYQRTLDGESVVIPPREVIISETRILLWESPDLTISVSCSSGTYIRALARDIAHLLDSRAYISSLRRIRIGNLTVNEAVRPPENFDGGSWWNGAFLSGVGLAVKVPGTLPAEMMPNHVMDFRHGKNLKDAYFRELNTTTNGLLAVCCESAFLGIVNRSGIDTYSYVSVFANPL